MVYCVFDLADAARGNVRRVHRARQSSSVRAADFGGAESPIPALETLPSLPGELATGWETPRLLISSRLNAFALSWMDKDGTAHLRVGHSGSRAAAQLLRHNCRVRLDAPSASRLCERVLVRQNAPYTISPQPQANAASPHAHVGAQSAGGRQVGLCT